MTFRLYQTVSLFYLTNTVGHIWCSSDMPFVRVSAFICNVLVGFGLLHFLNKVWNVWFCVLQIMSGVHLLYIREASVGNSL